MCLAKSVGRGGSNELIDVMVFQVLFNLNLPRFPEPRPPRLQPDGRIGPNTLAAIELFETQVMRLPSSDSIIAPGDASVSALLAGLPPGPSKEKLSVVMPRAI